jgi:hypothetical protein
MHFYGAFTGTFVFRLAYGPWTALRAFSLVEVMGSRLLRCSIADSAWPELDMQFHWKHHYVAILRRNDGLASAWCLVRKVQREYSSKATND